MKGIGAVVLGWVWVVTSCYRPEYPIFIAKFELGVRTMHHTWSVGNCTVYLKRNTQSFPGTDGWLYDDSLVTNLDGYGVFTQLHYGDYYLYAKGFDKMENQMVTGHGYIQLTPANLVDGRLDTVLWVTEWDCR